MYLEVVVAFVGEDPRVLPQPSTCDNRNHHNHHNNHNHHNSRTP